MLKRLATCDPTHADQSHSRNVLVCTLAIFDSFLKFLQLPAHTTHLRHPCRLVNRLQDISVRHVEGVHVVNPEAMFNLKGWVSRSSINTVSHNPSQPLSDMQSDFFWFNHVSSLSMGFIRFPFHCHSLFGFTFFSLALYGA